MTTKQLEKKLMLWGEKIKVNPPLQKGTEDSLDIETLNKLPETIILIEDLKANGIKSRDDLRTKGFLVASMLLKI